MADQPDAKLPDLTTGILVRDLADGAMMTGRVQSDEVLLVRRGDKIFAVGAHCTHYKGPLVDGLIVGDTVRCPWHHACFDLTDGDALRPPALDPLPCWRVERDGDRVIVRERLPEQPPARVATSSSAPSSVVILGGGAAGFAAADGLRREGYDRPITMISADEAPPSDRPNLSKDYLAGQAQEDWLPLKSPDYFADQRIELLLGTRATAIDVKARTVSIETARGERRTVPYGALLLATGADPVRLPIPGADGPLVHYLRSVADSRAIIAKAASAKHVVVVGASFIGLEVAASLRARGVAVDVVAPESVPLEKVMGTEVGRFIQSLHEAQGVVFHLGQTVTAVNGGTVTFGDGTIPPGPQGTRALTGDFVVMGVGVRPSLKLAEEAGIALERGVLVNEYLETSVPGIFAAGDIARWPDPRTGDRIRVEHWVVAERQGQAAARNMLGRREPFTAVPFFWSQHYDVSINYVGHAEKWDSVKIDGSLEGKDCAVSYIRGNRTLAVATVFRDRESLETELRMESEVVD